MNTAPAAPGTASDPAAHSAVPDDVDLIVIAKEPVPGRVKTRLTPPFTPHQAAALAEAALKDTLACVAATPAVRRVLALAGSPGPWLPDGFDVIPQRGDGLDERLANAFDDAHRGRPLLLVGMDTPQLTSTLLATAAAALTSHDAAFGRAADGGFWLLGLRTPDATLLRGVPMSRPDTGHFQLCRLAEAALTVAHLPELTDVDTHKEAAQVAAQAPTTHFATTYRTLTTPLRTSDLTPETPANVHPQQAEPAHPHQPAEQPQPQPSQRRPSRTVRSGPIATDSPGPSAPRTGGMQKPPTREPSEQHEVSERHEAVGRDGAGGGPPDVLRLGPGTGGDRR
ncbi:TIGR04282 family arsenosugar biosynthesis glycosyltransferase [Actinomadura harenae]|uniref:TIGR04282 family arsenosugar biosynthesis glycosyltransferase n=1 Tax=Actinomadura harenae TaxID=2483351 RepID=UPI001F028D10|nr:TIGR04282 family arsenosugar biosynthesis glycosyltransferase [Actinomadura harenae]